MQLKALCTHIRRAARSEARISQRRDDRDRATCSRLGVTALMGRRSLAVMVAAALTASAGIVATGHASDEARLKPKPAANAACAHDGHLDLFRQDGTAFGSEAECRRYAAREALVHLAVVETGIWRNVKGHFVLSAESGYGLQPGSDVVKCAIPAAGTDECAPPRTVTAEGTHAATSDMHWDEVQGGWHPDPGTFFCWNPHIIPVYVTGIYLVGTTADASPVRSRTIVPSHCG